MTDIAVILSGCGFLDGAEINEAVFALWALDEVGATAHCFAPNIPQHHVINHLTQDPVAQTRNVLEESARIARGAIQPLEDLDWKKMDALVLPGGFGAAKQLCDFAFEGAGCTIYPALLPILKGFAKQKKPVGFVCIAPALIPLVYPKGTRLTIGEDEATAEKLREMGAEHVVCSVTDIVVDETHRVVSTPAFMSAKRLTEAATGIKKLVQQVVRMI